MCAHIVVPIAIPTCCSSFAFKCFAFAFAFACAFAFAFAFAVAFAFALAQAPLIRPPPSTPAGHYAHQHNETTWTRYAAESNTPGMSEGRNSGPLVALMTRAFAALHEGNTAKPAGSSSCSPRHRPHPQTDLRLPAASLANV
jgi:hypothetical protein